MSEGKGTRHHLAQATRGVTDLLLNYESSHTPLITCNGQVQIQLAQETIPKYHAKLNIYYIKKKIILGGIDNKVH